MEKETFIITTGEHSSCLKENKSVNGASSECVSVYIGEPESVKVLDGHPRFYSVQHSGWLCVPGQSED